MFAVIDKLDVTDFNITRKPENFKKEDIGALYFDPDPNLEEVNQNTLRSLTEDSYQLNQDGPYKEFVIDEVFIEKSFSDLNDAKKFIRETFAKFKLADHYSKVDILNKLTFFYSFFKLKKVNCRFEVLSSNSCKKFHFDHVKARLISTYGGPATQVRNSETEEIMNLPSCSTLIVKGSRYPDFKPVTLHRSPPVDSTGTKRFLFIADFQ